MEENKGEPAFNVSLAPVIDKIEAIKKVGFGEVRVLIRNGAIYRILTTEDQVLTEH